MPSLKNSGSSMLHTTTSTTTAAAANASWFSTGIPSEAARRSFVVKGRNLAGSGRGNGDPVVRDDTYVTSTKLLEFCTLCPHSATATVKSTQPPLILLLLLDPPFPLPVRTSYVD